MSQIMADVIHHLKYARYLPELQRRELWEESVARVRDMHCRKYPFLREEIVEVFDKFVLTEKVLPSMRSLQFGGKPIELNNARIFNCCYAPCDAPEIFSETIFLLLSGCGVGYSVQKHHVRRLPSIRKPVKRKKFLVSDDVIGWSEAVRVMVRAYLGGGPLPEYDFRDIRPKGTLLKTSGGAAPGPEPLRDALNQLQRIFERKENGDKLTPLEVHDIMCHLADAVLSGGIRRSAMIVLFSLDDAEMMNCKSEFSATLLSEERFEDRVAIRVALEEGAEHNLVVSPASYERFQSTGKLPWWHFAPQRANANNSAVILRHMVVRSDWDTFWGRIEANKSGEPAPFFSNSTEWGANPCKPLYSLILTPEGYITFEQALQKDSLEVVTPGGTVQKACKPFKTGESRNIWRIKLSTGKYLYGTSNHQHKTAQGDWKRLDELVVGDELEYNLTPVLSTEVSDQSRFDLGFLMGWVHAEGSIYNRTSEGRTRSYRAGICVGNHEFDVIPYLESISGSSFKPIRQTENCREALLSTKWIDQFLEEGYDLNKDNLTWVYGKDRNFKLGFLQAVFTGDGSSEPDGVAMLTSTRRGALEVISNLLEEFGIISTLTVHMNPRGRDSRCYGLYVRGGQFQKIGFACKFKQDRLLSFKGKLSTIMKAKFKSVEVVEIDPSYDVSDVYDITVEDDSHSFVDTGVTTHNCVEISLQPFQMCNLVEINDATIRDQEDFNERAKAASFIATLQAGYTDFHYLRDIWKENTEKDALLGISRTGLAGSLTATLDEEQAALLAVVENRRVADRIGIKWASRVTCIKPAGTTSLKLRSSSGAHSWPFDFYLRRITLLKNSAIYRYLKTKTPGLIEDSVHNPANAFLCIPMAAPEGAPTEETETALEFLERVSRLHRNWIRPGHIQGENTHNVSATVKVKDHEWAAVGEWMWQHRDEYNGIAVLPADGGTYVQAPHEKITREKYEELAQLLVDIDLSEVKESSDGTSLRKELACSGGACELI